MQHRNIRTIFLLSIMLLVGVSPASADLSACGSAYSKQNPEDQVRLYTTCIENGKLRRLDRASAYHNRGVAYLAIGDYDHALTDFTKSINDDPKFGLGYFARSRIYVHQGKIELALADLDQAVWRRPSRIRAEAYLLRGKLHMSIGNYDQANSDFDNAMKRNRKLPGPYIEKAWLLATSPLQQYRNGTEAIKLATNGIKLRDDWYSHAVLAAAYAEAGNFEAAIREQTKAIEMTDPAGAGVLKSRLSLYQNGIAFHEPVH